MLDLLQHHLTKQFEVFQESDYDFTSFRSFLQFPDEVGLSRDKIPTEICKLILDIPSMLQELKQLISRDNVSTELRALAGGIYSYVFNPFDYINEEIIGFLGFVDDALVVFYGMQLIEAVDQETQFSATRNLDLLKAVEKCEQLLLEDLIIALKAYPQHVSGILSTADLERDATLV